ncbi:MAG: hypothetical protein P8R54_20545 [Myxococcota bacterium]|nr:hypothetical protein [Myxococcota bacterium]
MTGLILTALALGGEPSAERTLSAGMGTLNGWALANITTGSMLALQTDDPQQAAFHQMNAGWNTVNLALATTSLILDRPVAPQKVARMFWINTALDVGYMAGGLALRQRGLNLDEPRLVGWGESIFLQGSFLFVFDGVMGWKMQRYARQGTSALAPPEQ